MNDDYGYFGKGTTGYVHYMQAFNRNNGSGGGGRKPGGGCLTVLLALTIGILLLCVLVL